MPGRLCPATSASAARIVCWIGAFLAGFLFLTSDAERRSRAAAIPSSSLPGVLILRAAGAGAGGPVRDDEFAIAIVGASECFNGFERTGTPNGSLAEGLFAAIPKNAGPDPVVMDFSFPGTMLRQRMTDVERAIENGADTVIVTFAYHALPDVLAADDQRLPPASMPANEAQTAPPTRSEWGELADGIAGQIMRTHRTQAPQSSWKFANSISNPARELDRMLATRFPSYENRFASSVGPIVRPDLFTFEHDLAHDTIPQSRDGNGPSEAAALTARDAFYRDWLQRSGIELRELIAQQASPAPAFTLIAEPARSHGKSLLIMLTPIDRRVFDSGGLQILPVVESLVIADGQVSGVPIWSSLQRYDAGSPMFHDPGHLHDFREIGSALFQELLRLNLVPESWRTPAP